MSYKFETSNEFDSEHYANLIKKDEKRVAVNIEPDPEPDEEIVKVYEADSSESIQETLNNNTFKGLPPAAINAIKKANKIKKKGVNDVAEQASQMFKKLFNDLNTQYGIDVRLDFDSFSRSLEFIIEPKNKEALELYLSEAYSRYRLVLYSMYLNSISLLSAQILNPNYILSESVSYQDKLTIVKELYSFMESLENIYEKISISDTQLKLEKLSKKKEEELDFDNPRVRDFLTALTSSTRNQNIEDIN